MHALMTGKAPASPIGPLRVALEEAKSRFLARNLDRCGYIGVEFEPDRKGGKMTVVARFTMRNERNWHHVEAVLHTRDVEEETDSGHIESVFRQLDAGIGAARIARLFGPRDSGEQPAGAE